MSDFRNDWVEATIHHKPNCQLQIETKAFSPCLEKAKKEALKAVNKEIKLPGFRQGKAPEDYILKNFPKEIEEGTKKALGDIVFSEVYKLVKVRPLNQSTTIHYDLKNFSPTEADVVFSYEVEPVVPSVDVSSFALQKIQMPTVAEKEIEEGIRQMRFFYAEWKEISDRPVQEGDYVILDLSSLETTPPTQVFSKTRFEVSDKGMAKWMKNLIVGQNTHTAIEGMSEADPELSEEEKKNFPPRKVQITIDKIEEAVLPPLDEEFFKKIGVNSLEEMQKSVQNILERQIADNVREAKSDQVKAFILEKAHFDLPQSLVEEEKKYRLQQLTESPKWKKESHNMTKEERAQLDSDLLQQSKDAIYIFYLSRKILEDAKITFTTEEMEEAIRPYQHKNLSKDHLYGLAFARLVLSRAEDYLLDIAEKKLDPSAP